MYIRERISFAVLLLFAAAMLVNTLARAFEATELDDASKVLLMPLLAVWLFVAAYPPAARAKLVFWLTCVALTLSWLGDIFLIPGGDHDAWFVAGLVAFLFAHIVYIGAFAPTACRTTLKRRPWIAIFYAALLALAIGLILTQIPEEESSAFLSVALIVYIATEIVAALFATGIGLVAAIGALLFILSDATIALNRFVQPEWLPEERYVDAFVILSYAVAQLLIVANVIVFVRDQ